MKPTNSWQVVLLILTLPVPLHAIELNGTVREASGDTAAIVTQSDLLPRVGDKVDIFFTIPGADDEISVGTARVTEIGAESIKVKVENATGTVAKEQLVRIHSENPTKRAAATPAPPAKAKPRTADRAKATTTRRRTVDKRTPATPAPPAKAKPRTADTAKATTTQGLTVDKQTPATATTAGRGNAVPGVKGSKPVIGDCDSFNGHWDTHWGPLTIDMDGNRATGTYQSESDPPGTIVGSVSLNILEGEWMQAGSKGWLRLDLSADGESFDGTYRYDDGFLYHSFQGWRKCFSSR